MTVSTISALPNSRGSALLLSLLLLVSPVALHGFEIEGNKWSGASTEFYFDMSGLSLTGISWNAAFADALQEWNDKTVFEFIPVNEFLDPCASDLLNGIAFADNACGTAFGDSTLAVTLRLYRTEILGPPSIVEADIVVNEDVQFNIFDGNIPQFGIPGIDFRRVALHELGHVIGLDHENLEPAIMAPTISSIDRLQADDIEGANALYSGLDNCEVKSIAFGGQADALEASDCTVAELTVGGDDSSFIDVYRLSLDSLTTVELQMTSQSLDSVLLLANSNFDYVNFDNKLSGSCDSSLSTLLPAGEYYVLANTYVQPVREDCGNTGSYELLAAFSSAALQPLGSTLSALGSATGAQFHGGITANGGVNYANLFSPDDSLEILAEIQVDPAHTGQAGSLIVAALLDGEILVQNSSGQFLPYDPLSGIDTVAEKTLEATEMLTIAKDLVPAELGIESISVDFLVGYALQQEPGELYYHSKPINLTVRP
jgi:hypothetical protein